MKLVVVRRWAPQIKSSTLMVMCVKVSTAGESEMDAITPFPQTALKTVHIRSLSFTGEWAEYTQTGPTRLFSTHMGSGNTHADTMQSTTISLTMLEMSSRTSTWEERTRMCPRTSRMEDRTRTSITSCLGPRMTSLSSYSSLVDRYSLMSAYPRQQMVSLSYDSSLTG